MPTYTGIPTVSQWKSDSSVTFAIRRTDVVLSRIDNLMAEYFDRPSQRLVTLCDLYYSINFWLSSLRTNREMDKGREPAMQALFATVVRELCYSFECTVNVLPRELEFTFGRELTKNGLKTDMLGKKAHYATPAEMQIYRIWFKGGLAFQWDWWDKTLRRPRRVPLDSAVSYRPEAFVASEGQQPCVDYGGFVLTMSRVFYMAPHKPGTGGAEDGFYHSTYVAGENVMGAGTMLIKSGRIRRIRGNSGHYKPIDTNTLAVLQALRMYGVNIDSIEVENFLGTTSVKAPIFIKNKGDWRTLDKSREENEQVRKKLYDRKEDYRNPNRYGFAEVVDTPYGVAAGETD